MKADKKVIDTLNDLVRINEDRTACYERAAEEISDPFEAEIKTVFYQMADESRRYTDALNACVRNLGAKTVDDGAEAGDIFHVWEDMKVTFAGNDVVTSIQSCQCSDDAVLKSYTLALKNDVNLPQPVRDMVNNQYKSLTASFEMIKRYHTEFVEKMKLVS